MSLTKKLFFMITTLHLSTYIQTADVNPRFESALGQTTHESIWKAGLKATEILNQFFKQAVFPAYNTESNQISRFEAQKAFDLISDFFITHSRDTLATEASSMKALNAVSLDPVEGFGKFQDIESVYNPSKNEIRFFNNRSKNADQDEVIFVNIKTKVVPNGTLFAKEYEGMPLIATSVTEPSKGIPGAGFTTLYYGISKKDAQASDETDNVTPLFFASKNNAVSLDPVEGFGKFQDIESVYNPSKNEIRFFNNRSKNADQDEVIFVNIKTKVVPNGTLFAKEYEGMPLIATSVTEPSKGIPGAGFTTLYYGISKKDAQASDETDNVTPLFFASKNNEPIAY